MKGERAVRRGLTYNVEREPIAVPEFGRLFQDLARKIMTLRNPTERRYLLWALAELTAHRLHKEPKEETYKLVWNKLHLATNMQLDVDGPWGKPAITQFSFKPRPMKTKQLREQLPRWGTILPRMIEQLKEDAPQEELKKIGMLLAAFMFFGAKKWHSSSMNPELIADTLASMSANKIQLTPKEVKKAIDAAVNFQQSKS